jgi:sugar fermentation stimulation protein A
MVAEGHRAIAFYLVQRTDCQKLSFDSDLAPKYADAVAKAAKAGVEFLCYDCHIDDKEIRIGARLPVELP